MCVCLVDASPSPHGLFPAPRINITFKSCCDTFSTKTALLPNLPFPFLPPCSLSLVSFGVHHAVENLHACVLCHSGKLSTRFMSFSTRPPSMPGVMNMIPPKAIAFSGAAILAIFLLFSISKQTPAHPAVSVSTWWHKSTTSDDVIASVQNETLGVSDLSKAFSNVVVLCTS